MKDSDVLGRYTAHDSAAGASPVAGEHTPLPWRVDYLDKHSQRVLSGPHFEIATLWHHSVGSIEMEMEANAVLIVTAVNSHHALIAENKACHQRIDELEKAGQWRAIETAPRDDTPVLLFVPVNRPERRILTCHYSPQWDWGICGGAVLLGKPTHWMPLPAPPQTQVADNLTGASASGPGNCPLEPGNSA